MTATTDNDMVPPARDAIDFSYLPPMPSAEFERVVSEVQDILAFGDKTKRDGVLGGVLARDRRVREALFASFGIGYGVEPLVLREIASRPWSSTIPEAWVRDGVFDDDANFVPEQFYLAVYRKRFTDPEWKRKAIAQARRMLAAGRVDPVYLTVLDSVREEDGAEPFEQELQVYLPEGTASLRSILSMTSSIAASHMLGSLQAEVNKIQAKIAWVQAEHDRVFLEVWLPNMLDAVEWGQVKTLPKQLLRELYAPIAEQGYAGYRAAMIARVATPVKVAA